MDTCCAVPLLSLKKIAKSWESFSLMGFTCVRDLLKCQWHVLKMESDITKSRTMEAGFDKVVGLISEAILLARVYNI